MSEETGRETEVVEETAVETKSTEGKQNPADVTGGYWRRRRLWRHQEKTVGQKNRHH